MCFKNLCFSFKQKVGVQSFPKPDSDGGWWAKFLNIISRPSDKLVNFRMDGEVEQEALHFID